VIASEQVHRGASLLEARPEHRGPQKEDGAHGDAPALRRVAAAERQEPGEVERDQERDRLAERLDEVDEVHAPARDPSGRQRHERREPAEAEAEHPPSFRSNDRRLVGRIARAFQVPLPGHVLDDPERHADRRCAEAEVPVELLP
jgi:hypothetical protein